MTNIDDDRKLFRNEQLFQQNLSTLISLYYQKYENVEQPTAEYIDTLERLSVLEEEQQEDEGQEGTNQNKIASIMSSQIVKEQGLKKRMKLQFYILQIK